MKNPYAQTALSILALLGLRVDPDAPYFPRGYVFHNPLACVDHKGQKFVADLVLDEDPEADFYLPNGYYGISGIYLDRAHGVVLRIFCEDYSSRGDMDNLFQGLSGFLA